MNRRRIRNIGLFLISISLGLAGIISIGNKIDEYFSNIFTEQLETPCIYSFAASLIVGITCWIVYFIVIQRKFSVYVCEVSKKDDLKEIYELAIEEFGEDRVSPLELMKMWHNKNSKVFYSIKKIESSKGKYIKTFYGYFALIPLTKNGSQRLERMETGGSRFSIDDIVTSKGIADSLYIGAIVAKGFRARGFVLSHLIKEIELNRGKCKYIYTQPVNEIGNFLVDKYNFTKLDFKSSNPKNNIYKFELNPNIE